MNKLLVALLFFLMVLTCKAVNPVKEYIDHPENTAMKYEAVAITTSDNYKLKSWICFPDKEQDLERVLILAYGDAGNMSYWLRQTLEIVKQGYTVVMFDYRGFGESQAFEMDENQLYYDEFTTDLKAVLKYTQSRFKRKVGIWALSMGTITATNLYVEEPFDYMIAEGFVASPTEIIKRVIKYLDKKMILPKSAEQYEKNLSRLSLPMLLFAGDRDGLTTPEESYRAKFLNPKSDIVIFKGSHLQGFQALSQDYHGQRYIEAINQFYETIFLDKPTSDSH